MSNQLIKEDLFFKIAGLLQASRQSVMRAVNQTMVYTYFEIGRMIVEDEQEGKERAEYGKQVLIELSVKLTAEFGKGFSTDNLENMRRFFLSFSISEKESRISDESPISETSFRKFNLSWSHYLKLMRIKDINERNFYEIECAVNNWSLKELQRQFNSALYERLKLSRDKEGVKQLAQKGQIIEKPLDLLKDPYILEFLDLPETNKYSESDFEQALIDKLEHFLLELGKGFTFAGRQVRITIDEKHFKVDLVFLTAYSNVLL